MKRKTIEILIYSLALVLVILFLYAPGSHASTKPGFFGQGDIYVYTGAWSTHPGSSKDYQSSHKLLAVDVKSYMAGYFNNSYDEDAFFATKNFTWNPMPWPVELGVSLGASYGYRDCQKPGRLDRPKQVCPFGFASLFYTEKDFQIGVIYNVAVLAGTVRWRL